MEDSREDRFNCLACGGSFGGPAPEEADYRCPACGGELVASGEESEVAAPRKRGAVKVIAAIFVLLLLGGGIWLGWSAADLNPGMKGQAIAKILKKALEINSKTPMMVDKSTRLDRIVVEGETIISKSTLVNFTAEKAGGDIFKGAITPFLAGHYCKEKSTRKALELGVKYGHQYFGNDGALLYTATISVDDC